MSWWTKPVGFNKNVRDGWCRLECQVTRGQDLKGWRPDKFRAGGVVIHCSLWTGWGHWANPSRIKRGGKDWKRDEWGDHGIEEVKSIAKSCDSIVVAFLCGWLPLASYPRQLRRSEVEKQRHEAQAERKIGESEEKQAIFLICPLLSSNILICTHYHWSLIKNISASGYIKCAFALIKFSYSLDSCGSRQKMLLAGSLIFIL